MGWQSERTRKLNEREQYSRESILEIIQEINALQSKKVRVRLAETVQDKVSAHA